MLANLRPLGTDRTRRNLAPAGATHPSSKKGGWFSFRKKKSNRRIRATGEVKPPAPGKSGRILGRAVLCTALAAGIVAAFFGARYVLVQSDRFALVDFRFPPLHHVDADKLIEVSGLPLGRSLFALDLAAAEKRLAREPWVARVHLRRQLPHTIAVELVEREPRVVVALGALYLADGNGELFKRASGDEAAGLPVVTGLSREGYLAEPQAARAIVRRAIALDTSWREHGVRPPIGELHHDSGRDAAALFTVYFTHAGKPVAVRLGSADETTPDRLLRLDAVLGALDREGARAQLIHLDQRGKLDRVAVRLRDHEAHSLSQQL